MLKILVALYINVSANLMWLILVVINRSVKIVPINVTVLDRLRKASRPIIFVFWHAATFIPIYQYRGNKVCILTAKSLRGEILTRVALKLGYKVVRISDDTKASDRIKSLRKVLDAIEEGYDICVAVDGPSGPAEVMKVGPVYLAAKSGCPIIPLAVSAPRALVLSWRWDKYFVPLPFSTVTAALGDPIYVKPEVESAALELQRVKVEEHLKNLTRQIATVAKE